MGPTAALLSPAVSLWIHSKMQVSFKHQLKLNKAPPFLSIVLDVWSPQPALNFDKHTSWQTEIRVISMYISDHMGQRSTAIV
jgi:hypothetical protein